MTTTTTTTTTTTMTTTTTTTTTTTAQSSSSRPIGQIFAPDFLDYLLLEQNHGADRHESRVVTRGDAARAEFHGDYLRNRAAFHVVLHVAPHAPRGRINDGGAAASRALDRGLYSGPASISENANNSVEQFRRY